MPARRPFTSIEMCIAWERLPLAALVALVMLAAIAGCSGDGGSPASPTPVAETPTSVSETETPFTPTPRLTIEGAATFYGRDEGDAASGMVAGDFNDDGAVDVLLAASQADGPDNGREDAGEVFLFLGPFQPGDRRDAGRGEQDVTVYGADAGDQLGRAMGTGDVNADGIDDLILGAPFGDGPREERLDAGQVHVLLGSPEMGKARPEIDLATTSSDVTVYGVDPGDLAGFAIAAAEVTGDSALDLIVGAFLAEGPDNGRPGAGEVYLIAGAAALPTELDLAAGEQAATVFGAEQGDKLGETVAAGDVNGDDIDDLILPAPFASGAGNEREAAGETYVLFGPPSASMDVADGEQDITIVGIDPGDQLGHSLGSGDANGDGMADVLLGAVSADGFENRARLAGEAALVLGSGKSGFRVEVAEGEADTLIFAASDGDRLGRSAAVGDVNGDGLADLLVAAPGDDGLGRGRVNVGAVHVIFGSAAPPATIALGRGGADLIIEGLDDEDVLGTEVFATPALLARDVDGDGRNEVLVSAPRGDGPDNIREDSGEAYIVFFEGAIAD